MSEPTIEEVEAFITALNYGMKVTHKPGFLIALAEGWLKQHDIEKEIMRPTKARNTRTERIGCLDGCEFVAIGDPDKNGYWKCAKCGKEQKDIC